jgi:hypothetical protein
VCLWIFLAGQSVVLWMFSLLMDVFAMLYHTGMQANHCSLKYHSLSFRRNTWIDRMEQGATLLRCQSSK